MIGRLRAVAHCALLTIGLPLAALGAERDSLRGLRGIEVRVKVASTGDLHFDQEASEGVLRSRIELKMREAGITVFEDSTKNADPRRAVLHLRIIRPLCAKEIGVNSSVDIVGTVVQMALSQQLWIVGAKGRLERPVYGETWSRDTELSPGRARLERGLSRVVEDWSEDFVSDWLTTHPK